MLVRSEREPNILLSECHVNELMERIQKGCSQLSDPFVNRK